MYTNVREASDNFYADSGQNALLALGSNREESNSVERNSEELRQELGTNDVKYNFQADFTDLTNKLFIPLPIVYNSTIPCGYSSNQLKHPLVSSAIEALFP